MNELNKQIEELIKKYKKSSNETDKKAILANISELMKEHVSIGIYGNFRQ